MGDAVHNFFLFHGILNHSMAIIMSTAFSPHSLSSSKSAFFQHSIVEKCVCKVVRNGSTDEPQNSKSLPSRSQADSHLFDCDLVLSWLFWNPAISNYFSCPVRLWNSEVWLYNHLSSELAMKSQVLYLVRLQGGIWSLLGSGVRVLTGKRQGEIWRMYFLNLGVEGLTATDSYCECCRGF